MSYPIKATFIDEITYDMPSLNWNKKQYQDDFDAMKEVDINTLVIMRSVFYDKCLYPSKYFNTYKKSDEDFIKFILEEADKRDMKVYIGLYISNLTWNDGDYEFEIEQNKLFLEEVKERYSSYKSFIGFYIPHETGSIIYNIKETLEGLIPLCKQTFPSKMILLSPFFRGQGLYPDSLSPEETAKQWDIILENVGKDVDVIAYQDGTTLLTMYEQYFSNVSKVCKKYNIELWSNVETFERDVRGQFPPISFEVLRTKIEMAKKYVDNMITFEFSHFLSPNSPFETGKNLNKLYKDYYGK